MTLVRIAAEPFTTPWAHAKEQEGDLGDALAVFE